MRLHYATAVLAVAGSFIATGAFAADIYSGSTKDPIAYTESTPPIWSGWAITGSIGHARQSYDTKRTITNDTEIEHDKWKKIKDGVPGKPEVPAKSLTQKPTSARVF